MNAHSLERDERTMVVENAGYRWSYLVLSFGLLVLTAFRSLSQGEQSWDLLALVLLGGLVNAGYQGAHRVVGGRWVAVTAVTMVAAALLAALMVMIRA